MVRKVSRKFIFILLLTLAAVLLQGSGVKRQPVRNRGRVIPKGRPWYEKMFEDGALRIAVFWGWDHPRETIEGVFHAFETLNGKNAFFRGKRARIEIGLITQVHDNPKNLFRTALEDPTIDMVIYSGHARFGGGPAFAEKGDIFRSGSGDMIEDRHVRPYRVYRATSEDLDSTIFPQSYKIIFLNCCDSEGHFRKPWKKRFAECGAPIDFVTVEYPVFNLYDDRRILNFLKDVLSLSDWKTIKKNYDNEVHRRENRLVVEPVFIPDESELASSE